MLRNVGAAVFAKVSRALGIKGSEASFSTIDTKSPAATYPLDSYASRALTVQQYFIVVLTSVGAASWENFDFFSTNLITHPDNAWIMSLFCRDDAQDPDRAMIFERSVSGHEKLLAEWDTQQNSLFLATESNYNVVLPYFLNHMSPNAVGTPVAEGAFIATTVRGAIEPTAIGDKVKLTAVVHSAPQGVKVWGT